MGGLSPEDLAAVRELRDALECARLDGSWDLDEPMARLREVVGGQNALAVRMRESPSSWAMDLFGWDGTTDREQFQLRFQRFFATAPRRYAWYDAVSPEPEQRNRVIEAISRIPPGELQASRIYSEVLHPLGLARHKQLRVLVCDGPSLLAWFGIFQEEAVEARQRRILTQLVPSLRRRLMFQQQLRDVPRVARAMTAALENIGAPAFILDADGRIDEANSAGQASLVRAKRELAAALRDAVARRATHLAVDLTPLRERARTIGWLAVLRMDTAVGEAAAGVKATSAAVRWALSPRQSEVLGLIVRGASNARIGAVLRISERTVEDHVAAIIGRAQVGSRAQLIAKVLA